MAKARKSYPSDVSDEEWAFCVPYLTLMKEDAPQRKHALRAPMRVVKRVVDVPPGIFQ
jgi:transposase